jgi:redox-sensing transcriptional repressor
LHTEIGKILGLDETHNFVIIGAGNLGQAMANYVSFEKRGFIVKGLFDVSPRLEGVKIRDIPIRKMSELKDFIRINNIEIAVLTITKSKASEVADLLADTDIKGIWNFAHTDLKLPKHIIVENVHLSDSLMSLSYRIGHYGKGIPEE